MNDESVRAGLELCKEIGVISDWEYDGLQYRYILTKRIWDKNETHPDIQVAHLDETMVKSFTSPTDLSEVISKAFNGGEKVEKKVKVEFKIKDKLNRLIKRIEKKMEGDTEGLINTELGWVKVRLKLLEENGKLTKKDLLYANKLWRKYGK